MKKILYSFLFLSTVATAQETVYPAPAQKGSIAINNATIHVGNGAVITNGSIVFENGKITQVNTSATATAATVINANGKHVYPGLILSSSNLGLLEVPSVRATVDANEIGEINANVRSIVAYNTDSKVINTLKANGILLANIAPNGSLLQGTSSVVQLDAWHWEDAAYAIDKGVHINLPSLLNRPNPFAEFLGTASNTDPLKRGLEQIEKLKQFFRDAKAYNANPTAYPVNIKLSAVKGLFTQQQKLFVAAETVKEMLIAIDFAKEFGCQVVIVGGSDSYLIAPLLKQNNIPVILGQCHTLPTLQDDDVDQPYKTPAILQKAGVLFAINDDDGNSRFRNLAFNAGTAAAYGLTKEEALAAVSLNAAKILGIDAKTGSLEVGKDANIVISAGDLLDMKTSIVEHAFIQGRKVSLETKQTQLAKRYEVKYGL
ncbi:MAG: amidohydrolase [Bacteroidetes bacterium]|nr:MAG: amidohydrolase [Bacteroidota bacterium]